MSLTEENIKWKDEYCLGDKEVDRESKKLFDIAKTALSVQFLEDEGEVVSRLKKVIDELSFYVSTHYVIEQKFYQNLQYPKLDEHIQKHKKIVQNLNRFISNLNSLSLEEVKLQLFAIIKRDFIDHIIIEDKKVIKWENSLESVEKTFSWRRSFELGDPVIDNENKQLFLMAQEAFRQANQTQIDEKIRMLVKYLYAYMKKHFKYEEALMNESQYHNIAKHVLAHRKIRSQINHYVETLPHCKDKFAFEKGLAALIENTLIFHVMDEDEHFRQYYRNFKRKVS